MYTLDALSCFQYHEQSTKFKEILTAEQYEKFEKSHKRKANTKRSKGMRHSRK